jgi:hypothetical protein
MNNDYESMYANAIGELKAEQEENSRLQKSLTSMHELKSSLQELHDISGEANIPLTSVKGVRMMGKFLRARERAGEILAREEQK